MSEKRELRQKTHQPRGKDERGKPHEPVEILVPKRADFEKDVHRVSRRTGRRDG